MNKIRKYESKDKENLRKICIETSGMPTGTETERKFLYLMFNDYYSEVEPENLFVAVNDEDEAVGYILCAEDFDRYVSVFKKTYLPEIRRLGIKYYVMALGELGIHKLFAKKYKAHLHIDILSECQGKGTGTALMNALKSHLKAKGINSLMLSCGMGNKLAIRFYKKNNFRLHRNIMGSCIMVCEF
ncbi:MAG: GNAT family N-acetyltransferase [Ruminococcaceae bacterium]|nr:GNAT family N-acetyltransferase [Oscillospiraceae bacterium]MBQ9914000.1 GNAT family N-acetyltransferase [Clostridia bacterium]